MKIKKIISIISLFCLGLTLVFSSFLVKPKLFDVSFRNTINRANLLYETTAQQITLDIPQDLTINHNSTGIPSGTWFAYFSIDPNDNSGFRWTNVNANVYHLEYVIKNVVVDYVKYTYIGGVNYEWRIGTLNNNILTDIGFKNINLLSLTNEKRDLNNPENVVTTLDYFTFFIGYILLDYQSHYLIDLDFETTNDITLYQNAQQQSINLTTNYTTTNQLKTYDNRITYLNNTTEADYEEGYSSGYYSGITNVIDNPNQYGLYNQEQAVDLVTQNPNQYDLYTNEQYLVYGQEQYTAGEQAGRENTAGIAWITALFGVMTDFANLELLPNIKLIYLAGVTLIFGFVRLVIKWFK